MTSPPQTRPDVARPPSPTDAPPPVGTRRRSVGALFGGVALMNTAVIGASSVGSLVAADMLGPAWSGVPNTAGVLGTSLGTLSLAALMARRGRRTGLLLGFVTAALGAVLAAAAVGQGVMPLLLAGMVLVGIGNGAAQLSRYAAADLYPPDRRGFALSVVVWAGTVGALTGPALIAPAANATGGFGLPALVGPYLLAVLASSGAALAAASLPRLRVPLAPVARRSAAERLAAARRVLRLPSVRLALVAMIAAQLAMVSVMTMTPLHIHRHGHGLATVGTVLSAHMLGMFALAPVSGRLSDRFGGRTVITGGLATLVAAAVLAVLAPSADGLALTAALFLLGYGWNLCFVGGSSLLSRDLEPGQRARVQGSVDALVWAASAVATFTSGGVFATGGYPLLAVVAGLLTVFPAALLAAERRTARTVPGAR